MVAWELGLIGEKTAQNDEAVKWYTISAERFRRPEWKKKAEEALSRLGAGLPAGQVRLNIEENTESFHIPAQVKQEMPLALGEIPETEEETAAETGEETAEPSESPAAPVTGAAAGVKANGDAAKKRRRGRRGGRGRRRKGPVGAPSLPNQAFAESIESQAPESPSLRPRAPEAAPAPPPVQPSGQPQERGRPTSSTYEMREAETIRRIETEAPRIFATRTGQGRAGDPALASRMVHLESMLRRLLSGPMHRLDQADEAPAGPGVFLLSDSDQITSYYIESCQTLRVGLGHLVRGGRSGKGARSSSGRSFPDSGLKAKLAEHLGISESKVAQYMKDHCVVRWVQLDDDAAYLANFAIGVLRTPLNLE